MVSVLFIDSFCHKLILKHKTQKISNTYDILDKIILKKRIKDNFVKLVSCTLIKLLSQKV